jgi:hypothetical protein
VINLSFNSTVKEVISDLFAIDLFLNSATCHQAVDYDILHLPNAVCPINTLIVSAVSPPAHSHYQFTNTVKQLGKNIQDGKNPLI